MAVAGLIITGSAGFIGFNMVKYLEAIHQFDCVVSIDSMGYATTYNQKAYTEIFKNKPNGNCGFTNKNFMYSDHRNFRCDCDINDVSKFKKLCDIEYDFWCGDWYILDFASSSHVDNSISNPSSIFTQNASIPANLLDFIGNDNWETIQHYYHISTDEVYGDIPLEHKNDKKRYFTPGSTLNPSNPYSASKVSQDMYLTSIHHTFGVPITILRMANQFGTYQHPEKMLPASILRALRGETIKIYGEGKNLRQWTFVEDTVKAINNVMNDYQRIHHYDPPIIHLADDKNLMSNNDLVEKLVISLKRYNVEPKIEFVPDRLGHDEMYALKVLDEEQKFFTTPFDVALDKTVDSYVERFRNGEFA